MTRYNLAALPRPQKNWRDLYTLYFAEADQSSSYFGTLVHEEIERSMLASAPSRQFCPVLRKALASELLPRSSE